MLPTPVVVVDQAAFIALPTSTKEDFIRGMADPVVVDKVAG
jgi:hypothetical protein